MSPYSVSDLRTDLARIDERLNGFGKDLSETREGLSETRQQVQAHNRLLWALGGVLAFIQLLDMVLPNGLRGLF